MLLYSTNTWLAYNISERFYSSRHWVYCAPTFEMSPTRPRAPAQPPSSSPKAIYWEFQRDVSSQDRHSSKIAQNRTGLKKGALAKADAGVISAQDVADITWIVDNATFEFFRPLLYVIPRSGVESRLERVSPQNAASMFSEEYILEDLAAGEFEALELY